MIYILLQSLQSCREYHVILDHIITAPEFKVAVESNEIFPNAYLLINIIRYQLKFHCFFSRGAIHKKSTLFKIMAWCQTGDNPLSGPAMTQNPDVCMPLSPCCGYHHDFYNYTHPVNKDHINFISNWPTHKTWYTNWSVLNYNVNESRILSQIRTSKSRRSLNP